jgi:iron complex transport system substrate-binding protein
MPRYQRVISLLPAATEIVATLGAWDRLVAVSHECDYPPLAATLPRVTSSRVPDGGSADIDREVRELSATGTDLFALDVAAIARLAPDLIVTQTLCDVCAVSEEDVRRLAATLRSPCDVVAIGARTLDDVFASIAHMAAVLEVEDEGSEVVSGLRYRLRLVHERLKAARAPRPRVAVIEWTEPVFAAGHWVPDMVARAGGVDVMARSGDHSVATTPDQVREAKPQVLVFAPCGFGVARAYDEASAVLATLEWKWAEGLPAWALDGNALTSRPGPRLSTGVETLARVLHRELFGSPHADLARLVADRPAQHPVESTRPRTQGTT